MAVLWATGPETSPVRTMESPRPPPAIFLGQDLVELLLQQGQFGSTVTVAE